LSYREQQELSTLPERVEQLETEQQRLEATIADPGFYKESSETIRETLARLDTLQQSILDGYARWDELDRRTNR
jgi:ATP-binding cassette subfamily F protein uup